MVDVRDPRQYSQFLKIRTKAGDMIQFKWNASQHRLYEEIERLQASGRPVRVIILKARQLGFSTMAESLIFHRAATCFNTDCLIIAHSEDSTSKLFRMSKLFYEELPEPLKPMLKSSNAQELLFENPTKRSAEKMARPGFRSSIRCVTAGGRGIGRSFTFQNLHASEVAFWPGDADVVWSGALQAVPSAPGTMVVVESTANGFNWFKDFWDDAVRGENDFTPLFFPWFEDPEYCMAVPPDFEATPDERELQARYGLSDGQLAWRRWAIANNCGGDVNKFRQEYPSSADEAFLFTGTPVFDNEAVTRRRDEVRDLVPALRGEFVFETVFDDALKFVSLLDIRFEERAFGCIRIFEEPRPGVPYVIGGDTAGEGSDWFTAMVLDNSTGRLVAVMRRQFDEHVYSWQLFCLGKYYNDALIGVESNFTTYPITMLQRMGYPRQFVRQRRDVFTGKLTESFGVRTDVNTRPDIVAGLVAAMAADPEHVPDFDTLGEMLTFAYNASRKPEAMEGSHDDLVMGLAIAHFIRTQQDSRVTGPAAERERVVWTRDMWEDFNRASTSERDMLLARWGSPTQ